MGQIDKLIELKYLGKSNISLFSALLIFYIIIANSFTSELYGGQLFDFVKNNRGAKHTFGFITMLVIIMQVAGVTNITRGLAYTLLSYSWFVATTKLSLGWNLGIIILLVLGFIYDKKMNEQVLLSKEDQALEKSNVKNITRNNKKIKKIIMIILIAITLLGSINYLSTKQIQYGGDFDAGKFVFCKPSKTC